ncbi:hypothetical protein BP6252_00342 [Coleophoma cylindrospora]|uniref:Xylanolytic transcriptional activator regulatory domain-containing protein n=1 Tax=Coleophoma cylindrospora TaxID=1849047 RepID=A0A3D8SPR3_9HELO|nr:hypothetical protein BP6252_00342 [Coleophoma cylindrospora]
MVFGNLVSPGMALLKVITSQNLTIYFTKTQIPLDAGYGGNQGHHPRFTYSAAGETPQKDTGVACLSKMQVSQAEGLCDGSQPNCSSCARLSLDCRYVMPSHPKPQEARIYIKSLENRVAELEMSLARGGQGDAALDHYTNYNSPSDGDPGDKVEVHSLLSTVRDLSLNTSGSFVGGTSTITLARILESVVGNRNNQTFTIHTATCDRADTPPPEYISSENGCISPESAQSTAPSFQLHPSLGDKLLQVYLKHVSINFPVVHSGQIKELHRRRESIVDPCDEGILHLVYSLGGQYLEMTQSENLGNYQWKYHLEAALNLRDKILHLGNSRVLVYLLLLIQHCLRVPRHPGAWTFVGIAMRLCVELGLHRKKRSQTQPSLQSEIEKRLFWSCYYVDRELSIALGRPTCISDADIDVPLPLDVDEENQDIEVFRNAINTGKPANPPTSMTTFIHVVRLKRIESEIQNSIYRVDGANAANLSQETERILAKLNAWKDATPAPTQVVYMVAYHKCVRLLLQPQLYEVVINPRYLKLCTEACSGVCETYRLLHDSQVIAFSTLTLQSVFLAGLTLIYCIWQAPSSAAIKYMSSLSDCSIMLYIMTERWPIIRRYREVFEAIKRSVLHLIAEDKHQPRQAIPIIADDVRTTIQGLEVNMAENINKDDLEQMIGDMTGEHLAFWNEVDMNLDQSMVFQHDETDLQFDLEQHQQQNLMADNGMSDLTSDWIDSVDGKLLSHDMGWEAVGE